MNTMAILRYPQAILTAILITLVTSMSGCVAVLAGGAAAGTVAYVRGDLVDVVNSDLDRTYRASTRAVGSLQYNLIEESKDTLEARIVARTSGDDRVLITLKSEGDQSTRITIRIGTFGDQGLSLRILDEIKKGL
jgi:hypothetical protein